MIGALFLSVGIGYFFSLSFAAVLQGSNYRLSLYFRRAWRYLLLASVWFAVTAAPLMIAELRLNTPLRYLVAFFAYLATSAYLFLLSKRMRMHVVVTNRLLRLLVVSVLVSLLVFAWIYLTPFRILWSISPALSPLVLPLAALLAAPLEKRNNKRYVTRAAATLRTHSCMKIGITGSYGKTTVKRDLEKLLSTAYKTLATPENYNTPLGIAKTVSLMNGDEEIFIAEMGARRRGDIKELVEMVCPAIGIITGVAPQHLETFGTLDEVIREKEELSFGTADGIAYFNVSDPLVRAMYDRRAYAKVSVGYENADYEIQDLTFSEQGSTFTLAHGEDSLSIVLSQIGRAAVEDFALAAAVALDLGVESEVVLRAAKELTSAPHRQQIVRQGGLIILDDSYNINPMGAAAALDTLAALPAKRRIIYTCGMVELGGEEEALNRAFGRQIAEVCDVAIVQSGRYGDAVVRGIEEKGGVRVFRVRDTAEATSLFPSVLETGDVLLITSDLPRDYLI